MTFFPCKFVRSPSVVLATEDSRLFRPLRRRFRLALERDARLHGCTDAAYRGSLAVQHNRIGPCDFPEQRLPYRAELSLALAHDDCIEVWQSTGAPRSRPAARVVTRQPCLVDCSPESSRSMAILEAERVGDGWRYGHMGGW
jgi:hypothetical protein